MNPGRAERFSERARSQSQSVPGSVRSAETTCNPLETNTRKAGFLFTIDPTSSHMLAF